MATVLRLGGCFARFSCCKRVRSSNGRLRYLSLAQVVLNRLLLVTRQAGVQYLRFHTSPETRNTAPQVVSRQTRATAPAGPADREQLRHRSTSRSSSKNKNPRQHPQRLSGVRGVSGAGTIVRSPTQPMLSSFAPGLVATNLCSYLAILLSQPVMDCQHGHHADD